MASLAKQMILCHVNFAATSDSGPRHPRRPHHEVRSSSSTTPAPAAVDVDKHRNTASRRWAVAASTILAASAAMLPGPRLAQAVPEQSWGTRSFIKEKYFQPGLAPEEAVARIRQTADGLREMRHMLDTMAWRYVLLYVRLKSAYLDADLKNALSLVPETRRKAYVKTANELVDNMSELDRHVRSPKVYESYVYYEKTLKSIDEIVELLA